MAIIAARHESEPMMEMNTTPLIDVMLVLLIMFIITIPIQTHAVKVDLPIGKPGIVRPDKNTLAIDPSGVIFWNGAATDRVMLRRYLAQSTRLEPRPELHFQPDAQARYAVVDEILADIKTARVTNVGFVGNEQYRNF